MKYKKNMKIDEDANKKRRKKRGKRHGNKIKGEGRKEKWRVTGCEYRKKGIGRDGKAEKPRILTSNACVRRWQRGRSNVS